MQKVIIEIPMNLEPQERGDRFDLPLCDLFDETDGGDVVGGGTIVRSGRIEGVEIEIELTSIDLLSRVADILVKGGAPPTTSISIISDAPTQLTLAELNER